mmetsp:Transcript_64353/g.143782  ORF Transcript_64353/g.143782 Transcript_64353/m.143782 type:complete len:398 (+) Transcript_64353:1501-2694(+)
MNGWSHSASSLHSSRRWSTCPISRILSLRSCFRAYTFLLALCCTSFTTPKVPMPRILSGLRSASLSSATLPLRTTACFSRSMIADNGPSCFCTSSRVATMQTTSPFALSSAVAFGAEPSRAASPKKDPSAKELASRFDAPGPDAPPLTSDLEAMVPLCTTCKLGIGAPAFTITLFDGYLTTVMTFAMCRLSARLSGVSSGMDDSAFTFTCSRLISCKAPTWRLKAACVMRSTLEGSLALADMAGCASASPISAPSPKKPPGPNFSFFNALARRGGSPGLADAGSFFGCTTTSTLPACTMYRESSLAFFISGWPLARGSTWDACASAVSWGPSRSLRAGTDLISFTISTVASSWEAFTRRLYDTRSSPQTIPEEVQRTVAERAQAYIRASSPNESPDS